MDDSSPRRNLQPLLDGASAPATTVGGGYAPPGQRQEQPSQGAGELQQQESYDLNLTVTDADGTIQIPQAGDGDANLPQLPPLISYCSYVKYACAFGKWLLLVAIANAVGIILVVSGGYFGYEKYLPFDSWKGGLLALIWLVTSAWLFVSAKVVERDVERYDQMAQYEQGRVTEHQEPATTPSFVPNYDAIYGQVSRRLDRCLSKKINATSLQPQQQQPPPSGTSCLVNFSFALWGLFLGAGIFLGTGNLLGKHYKKSCGQPLPDDTSNSTTGSSKFKGDFSKISNFPDGVKEWITEDKDNWDYRFPTNDDDFNEDYIPPTHAGDFPIASEADVGLFCNMKDGTVFFAGQSPANTNDDDKGGSGSNRLVLVQAGPNGTVSYHQDIVKPRMFIPVAATLDTTTNTASSYCFTASGDKDSKNRQRSWDKIIRTSPIHCITTNDDGSFEFRKKVVAWTDKTQRGPMLSAATSGSQVFIAHTGNADYFLFQEVLAVEPLGEDLSTEVIYHLTSEQDGYRANTSRNHENTKCVQGDVIVVSMIAALHVLVASSMWLIIREGIPSGAVPMMYAIVLLVYGIAVGLRDGDHYFGYRGNRWLALLFFGGTVFFHIILCCGDGRTCRLPAWIGRDMYVCGLYGWITAFILLDPIAGEGDISFVGMVFFGMSGLILDHPTVTLMGWASVLVGVFLMILWPIFGYDMFDLVPGLLCILVGAGMISVQSLISNNRVYMSVFCRPMSRAFHSMLYGSTSAASGTTRSVGPVPVSV
jgi:hypothetical protein